MLYGNFAHNIAPKGRMNFPARMREELGERFWVSLWSEDCLAVFSDERWNSMCERIDQLPIAEASRLQYYLFPNACMVEPDKQGRILIPQNLREAAKLDKDVVVIGLMSRAEIWDKTRWEESKLAFTREDFKARLQEQKI